VVAPAATFLHVDGSANRNCTPEAPWRDLWLFRQPGNGTFEDVTAKSGIFDTTSKSLGAAPAINDGDGWARPVHCHDTQPNKLYRNLRDGTFRDARRPRRRGFSEDGKSARRKWAWFGGTSITPASPA